MDLDAFCRYKETGDITIRNKLVTDNLRLVYSVVYSYTKTKVIKGLGEDGSHRDKSSNICKVHTDLVQAGVLGLITAIEKFDLSRLLYASPNLFYVFARWQILDEIQRAWRATSGRSKGQIKDRITPREIAKAMVAPPEGHLAEARHDLAAILADATPDDLAALVALSEGATPMELAEALKPFGVPCRSAAIRADGALVRARETIK